MTKGTRIKELRTKFGYTLDDLALKLSTSKQTIFKYENDIITNIPSDKVELIATLFNVSPAYIMGWELNNDSSIYDSINMGFIRMPLYSSICCGNGGFNDDDISEYIAVPSKGLNKTADYFVHYAQDESMKDAGINDGDLLIFEKTSKIEEGEIGTFCVDNGEVMCKKYKKLDNIIMLQPMNSEYDTIVIDPSNENFRCIGKLKKVIKDF